MGLTRAEQETVIRWDEAEQEVRIWSASPKTWRRMGAAGGGAASGDDYRGGAEWAVLISKGYWDARV